VSGFCTLPLFRSVPAPHHCLNGNSSSDQHQIEDKHGVERNVLYKQRSNQRRNDGADLRRRDDFANGLASACIRDVVPDMSEKGIHVTGTANPANQHAHVNPRIRRGA